MKRINVNCLLLLAAMLMAIMVACKKDSDNNDNNTPAANTMTDVDGNVYNTITIGTQTWMKENLKVTHYRNGDAIPNVTDISWTSLLTGACCNYDNNEANSGVYGKLYNWYAVHDSRNIAPAGWHVPSDAEWATLAAYLGGDTIAGGKMKETGTAHWQTPNTAATNNGGFTALPGGNRTNTNEFLYLTTQGLWWSSTEKDFYQAWCRSIYYWDDDLYLDGNEKISGLSVRCVKD